MGANQARDRRDGSSTGPQRRPPGRADDRGPAARRRRARASAAPASVGRRGSPRSSASARSRRSIMSGPAMRSRNGLPGGRLLSAHERVDRIAIDAAAEAVHGLGRIREHASRLDLLERGRESPPRPLRATRTGSRVCPSSFGKRKECLRARKVGLVGDLHRALASAHDDARECRAARRARRRRSR